MVKGIYKVKKLAVLGNGRRQREADNFYLNKNKPPQPRKGKQVTKE